MLVRERADARLDPAYQKKKVEYQDLLRATIQHLAHSLNATTPIQPNNRSIA
jgi:hypothetical protein